MSNDLDSLGVVVQEQDARTRHLLGFHHSLQISQKSHVFGHVCGQHLQTDRLSLFYPKLFFIFFISF